MNQLANPSHLSASVILAVVVLAFSGTAGAQDPALVLGQGGIQFPDATIQTTAAVGTVAVSDGVRVINQQCATVDGCFFGDDPGFPVTIVAAGSYRLTSNLDVTLEDTPQDVTAIIVDTVDPEGVTIDLNGFRIRGPNFCPGTPPTSCSSSGTGVGIQSNDNRITVRNGRIFGMGDDGIRTITALRVEGVQIEDCGGDGIQTSGSGDFIHGNVVRRNGGNGIVTGSDSLVSSNLVQANIGTGLVLGSETAYGGNVVNDNTGGTVTGGSLVQIGDNACNGGPCP